MVVNGDAVGMYGLILYTYLPFTFPLGHLHSLVQNCSVSNELAMEIIRIS